MQTLATMDHQCDAPILDELILAAPDIGNERDNNDFAALWSGASRCFKRMTMYVSANDSILALSESIHGGVPRTGRDPPAAFTYQSGPSNEAVGVTDVIDASNAPGDPLGHGYFATSYEVITDITETLHGVPADGRATESPNVPHTLVCGDEKSICDTQSPRYSLLVAHGRRFAPNFLDRLILRLIPLDPVAQ